MLVAALEAEVAAYLEAHRDERGDDGHALVVRNGKGRPRKVTVGAGTIPVSAPRVNHRRTDQDGERRRFTSRILPPYMRRSPKVAEVLPVVYLRGPSTGDFREALAALLGDDAAGLSATNIVRLPNEWETEYRAFQQPSLGDSDHVYVWVDGVHFKVRFGNILLPKRLQPRVKAALHEVMYAASRLATPRSGLPPSTARSTRRPSRPWRRTPTCC